MIKITAMYWQEMKIVVAGALSIGQKDGSPFS